MTPCTFAEGQHLYTKSPGSCHISPRPVTLSESLWQAAHNLLRQNKLGSGRLSGANPPSG